MNRIVFFGMSGAFSTISLRALAAAGLSPALVVHGVERNTTIRGPIVEDERARGWWWSRAKKESALVPTDESNEEVPAIETDLSKFARTHRMDILRTSDANALRCRARIAGLEPTAFVVAGFPHLLSRDLLSLSKRGGLNLHPGKLPEERGPSPMFWALREGRTRVHFTIHVLDEGEDSGDVVARGELDFVAGSDGREVLEACAKRAAPSLVRAVRGLLDGDLIRAPQKRGDASRKPRPAFRDGAIDTSKTAEEVYTFVGGCARVYSLFVESAGDRFFVESAVSFDPAATLPFEYALTGDRLLLRCKTGIVELVLKPDGAIFSGEYGETGESGR